MRPGGTSKGNVCVLTQEDNGIINNMHIDYKLCCRYHITHTWEEATNRIHWILFYKLLLIYLYSKISKCLSIYFSLFGSRAKIL